MMKKLLYLLFPALLGCVLAQAQQPPQQLPIDPRMRVGTLENGMRYYIMHNNKPENMGEFHILHNVGAIDETDSQNGLAHFLEHMAFNGLEHLPEKQMINYLETIGVMFGRNLNAGTGQEVTMYMITDVPLLRQGIIDTALLILHDWSHYITLDPTEVDNERGVIIEELRTVSGPSSRMQPITWPVLFNDSRYAERNVIGTEEVLRTFSHQEIVDFYNRWYRPDLQAVVIVGDFDVDRMEQQVKEVLGSIPRRENPQPKEKIIIPDNTQDRVAIASDPEQRQNTIQLLVPIQKMPEEWNNTLPGLARNALRSVINYMAQQRLSDLVKSGTTPLTGGAVSAISLTSYNDVLFGSASVQDGKIPQAVEILSTEIERIRRYGFTASELEIAKAQLLKAQETAYENRNDRKNNEYVRMAQNNFYDNMPILDPEMQYQFYQQFYGSLSIDNVNNARSEFYPDNNVRIAVEAVAKQDNPLPTPEQVLAAWQQGKTGEIEAPVEEEAGGELMENVPQPGTITATSTDVLGNTVWKLSNGATVVVRKTDFKQDEVLFSMTTEGGLAALDDQLVAPGKLYTAYTSRFGISDFSNIQLPKMLSGKRASVRYNIDTRDHGLSGTASPKDLETLLQLIHLRFTDPRFDAAEYGTAYTQLENLLKNMENNPTSVFMDSLSTTLYNGDLRASASLYKAFQQTTLEGLQAVHASLYDGAANAVFTFIGNFDTDELQSLVQTYIGSLPTGKQKSAASAPVPVSGLVTNFFERSQEQPKSSVGVAFSGTLAYTAENQIRLSALQHILNLRYTEIIREEMGATYGVRMSNELENLPAHNYLILVTYDTNGEMALETMEVVYEQVRLIAQNGPTADDLNKYREFAMKNYENRQKENSAWLQWNEQYHFDGLNLRDSYRQTVQSMTAADLQQLAAHILSDNNIVRVVMFPDDGLYEEL